MATSKPATNTGRELLVVPAGRLSAQQLKGLSVLGKRAGDHAAKYSASHGRGVYQGGFNPFALLQDCHTISSPKLKNPVLALTFFCGYMPPEPEEPAPSTAEQAEQQAQKKQQRKFFKWDNASSSWLIACQRHMNNEQAKAVTSDEQRYPAKEEDWVWVKYPAMDSVTFLVDVTRGAFSPANNFTMYQLFNMRPRMKEASKIKEGEQPYTWMMNDAKPFGPDPKVPPQVLMSLCWRMPEPVYLIRSLSQQALFLRVVPKWNYDQTLAELNARSPVYALATMQPRDGENIDAMTFAPKETDPKVTFWVVKNKDDTKKRTDKIYSGSVSIVQVVLGKIRLYEADLTLWNDMVESLFFVKNVELWLHMRFIVAAMPLVVFATVNSNKVKQSNLNVMKANQGGGGEGLENYEDIPDVPELNAEQQHQQQHGGGGAAPTEALSADAVMAQEEAKQKETGGGSAEDDSLNAHIAGWLALNPQQVWVDAAAEYRKFGIPVTTKWLETTVTVIDPMTGQKRQALQPVGRVVPSNYPPATKVTLPDPALPNFSDPDSIPEVVNVSDYLPKVGVIKRFGDLVDSGKAEWRVIVNSPIYTSDSAPLLAEAIAKLTPEQGCQLLDHGHVQGVQIPWIHVPSPRYNLFFLKKRAPPKKEEVAKLNEQTEAWAVKLREFLNYDMSNVGKLLLHAEAHASISADVHMTDQQQREHQNSASKVQEITNDGETVSVGGKVVELEPEAAQQQQDPDTQASAAMASLLKKRRVTQPIGAAGSPSSNNVAETQQ